MIVIYILIGLFIAASLVYAGWEMFKRKDE